MDLAYLWFWIVGFLFVGYFVLDGFDFGVGMSLPFLGKDDIGRRQIINTIGPVWDLNETWVIVAGACLFAAFPEWYATLFSGFYLALLLILLALILRGVSFEYRHQRDSLRWKRGFDTMIVVGSAVPALLWGVAFAQHRAGRAARRRPRVHRLAPDLLNPYGLLGGLTTLLLFFTHGVYFVALKTDGQVHDDARRLARRSGLLTVVVAAAFLVWTIFIAAGHGAPLWPRRSRARRSRPSRSSCRSCSTCAIARAGPSASAQRRSSLAVLTLWFALFPYVMPSSTDPANSLTIENASSTDYTLTIMTLGGA